MAEKSGRSSCYIGKSTRTFIYAATPLLYYCVRGSDHVRDTNLRDAFSCDVFKRYIFLSDVF